MAEHLSHHPRPERHRTPEHQERETHLETGQEKRHSVHGHHEKNAHEVAKLQRQVEALSLSGKEMAPAPSEKGSGHHHRPLSHEVKAMALRRLLKRAQHKLSPGERVLSNVVHQPTVERASELGSKTVARPSGILGGGLVAFIGSLIFYLSSRHYGFEYNFSMVLLLFVGGFFLGMCAELCVHIWRRRS